MLSTIKNLIRYRELLVTFTVREIKIRYKQTILGLGWAVLQPLTMMVIFTIIFSRFLKVESEGFPYPIFSYSALLFWTFFSTSLSFGTGSLVRMSDLIRKIYFPREIIPLSAIFASLVDMLIASLIFLGMMAYYGVGFSWNLLYIPFLVLIQFVFTSGVVFLLSALNVFYRDIRHGIPFLVQIWMYASPIVYSMDVIPERWRILYVVVNPLAGLIASYRQVILHRCPPDMENLLIVIPISLSLAVAGLYFFKKAEGNFADVI